MQITRFFWDDIRVELPDSKVILDNISGSLGPGQVMALMGPSGCGKTTLLNILAQRGAPPNSHVTGNVRTNSFDVTPKNISAFSCYVEQEDALIGSLTVRETVDFACKLSDLQNYKSDSDPNASNDEEKQARSMSNSCRSERVMEVLTYLGLQDQADVRVGTPLQKGLSGGQKRRLSVAVQIVSRPSVLFLDEPTSGLDSTAAYAVVKAIKETALQLNMMVIISIHQPSTATFNLFDKALFLSKGQTIYNGGLNSLVPYFEKIGSPIPQRFNPAEYILEMTNVDFNAPDDVEGGLSIQELRHRWDTIGAAFAADRPRNSLQSKPQSQSSDSDASSGDSDGSLPACKPIGCIRMQLEQTKILTHRLFIKSRRDILAYYVRIVMYLALAILMGTVWLRLGNSQVNIQPYINAIFFSGAFLSFMSVAYIPAYIEDLHAYKKESMNGLYGPLAFIVSNFIVGIPFIFIIVILFSVVTYFMCNFRHSASGFWYYVMWLFLDLLAAESMTIFVSTAFPIFVIALALTAFLNGLWMCVNGFLVSSNVLNVFWYYTFYWINYQRYVFQGMMFNEFTSTRVFNCASGCHCMYSSDLESQCKIAGTAVLQSIGYGNEHRGMWAGILIAIIAFYRIASYAVLRFPLPFIKKLAK